MQLSYQATTPPKAAPMKRFIVDCTPNPRPFSRKLADRTITHAPNPAPGNKPICVGHQYSVVTLLPDDVEAGKKRWLLPLSVQRVASDQKGHEVGMQQTMQVIENLGLQDELSLIIGDSLYGSKACRMAVAQQKNCIHLFRLAQSRHVFAQPAPPDKLRSAGRNKEFGEKMQLNNPSDHPPCDKQATTTWITRRGKKYTVEIQCWENRLLRGSRSFRSSQHPLHVMQIRIKNAAGECLYKRPLWLAVLGKRRDELDLIACYENYAKRYDIEHFFRFGKQCLLMDAYCLPIPSSILLGVCCTQ